MQGESRSQVYLDYAEPPPKVQLYEPMPITILIVDDHPIVLKGLCALLSSSFADADILEASGTKEAEAIVAIHYVDFMIADLELKGGSGMQLIRNVRAMSPSTRTVVYTMHEEPWSVSQIADLDTEAVVMKSDSAEELISAIRSISEGGSYYSRLFLHLLMSQKRYPERLSERELQVVELTAKGLSAIEAGQLLYVSANTIEFHRRRIMQKLGASNAAEMISRAAELGWNVNL